MACNELTSGFVKSDDIRESGDSDLQTIRHYRPEMFDAEIGNLRKIKTAELIC